MMTNQRYRVIGAIASPYSVKMRAIMRYRRLPFDWVLRTPEVSEEIAQVRPAIVPVVRYPDDGSYHVDSTPIAFELERRHPGARSIVPEDPGLAFLSYLIEDMADEWGTKLMFHYRWFREVDQEFCSRWIAREAMGPVPADALEAAAQAFRERQVGRMPLVGCTPENAPLIEDCYGRVLDIFEAHVGDNAFLFGGRPALADFGWYGQLYQCAIDPTPMAIMRDRAPKTFQWLQRVDDASGVEGEWIDADAPVPEAVTALLRLAGEVYLPFLLANAEAVASGDETFRMEVMGHTYEQGVFKYQAKCLGWLREALAGLEARSLGRTEAVLREAGCWEALRPGAA
jgi:glutathione S-transferase